MRAPRQRVVQRVEEEGVVAVTAGDAAHSRHGGQRGRGRWGRREVDNPLAVRPRACDPLAAALADKETVAGAADVPRKGGDKIEDWYSPTHTFCPAERFGWG